MATAEGKDSKVSVKVGATELSEEDIAAFREVFAMVDADQGGSIDAGEVKQLLHLLGVRASPEQISLMIADIDKDGNGAISFEEFLQVMAGAQQPAYSRRDLMRAFRLFAEAGSAKGCIEPAALVENLVKYGGDGVSEEEVERLVKQLEANSDGHIKWQEAVDVFFSS